MTTQNHLLCDTGQDGDLYSCFDSPKGFDSGISQGLDSFKDGLSLKGLSFIEAYLEGVLWIAVEFRPTGANSNKLPSFLGLANFNADTGDASTCFRARAIENIKPVYGHFGHGWDQDDVLICDIERVEPVKTKNPVFIGLYIIKNSVDDFAAWRQSKLFMSLDGTFKRLPILSEGEPTELVKRCSVGFGGDMISVVEGGPEVVKRIAKHRRGVFVERDRPVSTPMFQKTVFALGPNSFHVITSKLPENGFEAFDVMFGPFDL